MLSKEKFPFTICKEETLSNLHELQDVGIGFIVEREACYKLIERSLNNRLPRLNALHRLHFIG